MKMRETTVKNVIIGSGASGFAAALRLYSLGEKDTVLITENVKAGTSRNTGSDKQTFYKLSLSGSAPDSIHAMAEDLFAGGAVDGDQALCEAALSVRGFYHLVELGVPFPCNEYSEYMGYKTDHDRGRRATSAGPYTSKLMTEALERSVREKHVSVLDRMQAIHLLVKDKKIYGVLCLDKKTSADSKEPAYLLIWADNVVLATGGPAGMYRDSVYPLSQLGGSGLAFRAGAIGKNLTEWQFGMASVAPRWNVSGTYMQVLPRIFSTDRNGQDEREFLKDYFDDYGRMLSLIFLKGYQWPFDVNKIFGGSSEIDLLIYQETVLKGRRVFLDYRNNPETGTEDGSIDFSSLSEEAYAYLKNAGALFGTPIERLSLMNEPAIRFYMDHGIDLYTTPLEIAVCAQHNNGGLATDADWQTCVQGLYAIGEVNGSHGVTRPGGTALNAGQAGAIRAAEAIYFRNQERTAEGSGADKMEEKIRETLLREANALVKKPFEAAGDRAAALLWEEASGRMSAAGGMIRSRGEIQSALHAVQEVLENYDTLLRAPKVSGLGLYYRLQDMLISQKVYLSAMLDYMESGAGSRGSALYTDPEGEKPEEEMPELYRCRLDQGAHRAVTQEAALLEDGRVRCSWRAVRPLPQPDEFFENQWRKFRERNRI